MQAARKEQEWTEAEGEPGGNIDPPSVNISQRVGSRSEYAKSFCGKKNIEGSPLFIHKEMPMVYNEITGIYEESSDTPSMYNMNPQSRQWSDEPTGNTCIGGNAAFMPNYRGYNAAQGRQQLNAAVQLQRQSSNAREDFAARERARHAEKEANTARLCKVAEQNYKKSAGYANLQEEIKLQKKQTRK